MKRILLLLALTVPLISFGQAPTSELTQYLWYIVFGFAAILIFVRWTRYEKEKALDEIYRHKHHHFEDFALSANDFYETLTTIIEERAYPDMDVQVVSLSVGGYFDGKRAYLQVQNKDRTFYVCAAPFGKDFFISYRLGYYPEGIIEKFFRRVFGIRPPRKTFFELDAELMFVEGIQTAIMRTITKVTEERGLRKLSPQELTPQLFS